jgi:hypothetical protein
MMTGYKGLSPLAGFQRAAPLGGVGGNAPQKKAPGSAINKHEITALKYCYFYDKRRRLFVGSMRQATWPKDKAIILTRMRSIAANQTRMRSIAANQARMRSIAANQARICIANSAAPHIPIYFIPVSAYADA